MGRLDQSVPDAYFDNLYAKSPDPWGFTHSAYEKNKYSATLKALPRARYERCFEVGCSIGGMTALLAERCRTLVATDVSAAAVSRARARCAEHKHVDISQLRIPAQWPKGSFDLIMLSEVLCLLGAGDIERTAARVDATLRHDGHIVVVHVLGQTHFSWLGDEVVTHFISLVGPFTRVMDQARTDRYRIDVLERR